MPRRTCNINDRFSVFVHAMYIVQFTFNLLYFGIGATYDCRHGSLMNVLRETNVKQRIKLGPIVSKESALSLWVPYFALKVVIYSQKFL